MGQLVCYLSPSTRGFARQRLGTAPWVRLTELHRAEIGRSVAKTDLLRAWWRPIACLL